MPYVPPHRHWYIAEMVEQFDVEGEPTPLVHVNLRLISADSPEEAFAKAERLGREAEFEFTNTDQKHVNVRFRGLRDLFLIYDQLEDGAELMYEEHEAITESELAAMLKPKSELAVFRETPPATKP